MSLGKSWPVYSPLLCLKRLRRLSVIFCSDAEKQKNSELTIRTCAPSGNLCRKKNGMALSALASFRVQNCDFRDGHLVHSILEKLCPDFSRKLQSRIIQFLWLMFHFYYGANINVQITRKWLCLLWLERYHWIRNKKKITGQSGDSLLSNTKRLSNSNPSLPSMKLPPRNISPIWFRIVIWSWMPSHKGLAAQNFWERGGWVALIINVHLRT